MDLQEISDRLEIEQLLVSYAHAIDDKDWDRLDDIFTPDAHLDYSSSGGPDGKGDYPTIKAWLQSVLPMFPVTHHLIGKSEITIDGDEATCRTILYNPMGLPVNDDGIYDTEGSGLHVRVGGGVYHDTCVRTSDGWRISTKTEEHAFDTGGFPPFE